jgi:hypothetical protein
MKRFSVVMLVVLTTFTAADASGSSALVRVTRGRALCGCGGGAVAKTGACPTGNDSGKWSIQDVNPGGPVKYTACKSLADRDIGSAHCFGKDNDIITSISGKLDASILMETLVIKAGGCPDHGFNSPAPEEVALASYIEIHGNLTFPLITSATAFTASMRTGVAKALAAQCSADVANVVLAVVNESSSSSGGRRVGVGGVVVK